MVSSVVLQIKIEITKFFLRSSQ